VSLATVTPQILPKLDIDPMFLKQKQAEVSPGFKNSKSSCFLISFFIALIPVIFCQIWNTQLAFVLKQDFDPKSFDKTSCKFKGTLLIMNALLKVAGKIKLILSANVDACFINL
jgi:hypothetical protein